MPCRVELSEAEIEANRRARTDREIATVVKPLQERNDELTHENDILREALLKIIGFEPKAAIWIGKDVAQKIEEDQVEHRKEDLRRLEVYFLEQIQSYAKVNPPTDKSYDMLDKYTGLLGKIRHADPEKPLEEQLGFDPDDY